MNPLVTLEDIRAAAARLGGLARVTPLIDTGTATPAGQSLWLKCENLQAGGAFKIRGAANVMRQLTAGQLGRGVITYSSGNHGLALAAAARRLGCPAVIVVPATAPAVKVEAARALGAEILVEGTTTLERQARAEAEAQARGLTVVPPFDHAGIIAGQGTIGLEIAEQHPAVGVVFVPMSGGGLIAGVAAALKALRPGTRVVGVEPAVTPRMTRSLEAGRPVAVPPGASLADGLLAVRPGDLTFGHVAALVDEVAVVPEPALADALRWACRSAKLVVEPSGAASVAVARGAGVTTWTRDGGSWRAAAGPAVAVISGGNVDPGIFTRLIAAGAPE